MIIVLWIVLCFIFASYGASRSIGYWGAFFACLFLSPIIGLLLILLSEKKSDKAFKNKLIKATTESKKPESIADELEKLHKLKQENLISESEYQALKKKLIL